MQEVRQSQQLQQIETEKYDKAKPFFAAQQSDQTCKLTVVKQLRVCKKIQLQHSTLKIYKLVDLFLLNWQKLKT